MRIYLQFLSGTSRLQGTDKIRLSRLEFISWLDHVSKITDSNIFLLIIFTCIYAARSKLDHFFRFRLWWNKESAIGYVKPTSLIDLKKHKLDQTLPISDILKWKLLNLTKRDFLNVFDPRRNSCLNFWIQLISLLKSSLCERTGGFQFSCNQFSCTKG